MPQASSPAAVGLLRAVVLVIDCCPGPSVCHLRSVASPAGLSGTDSVGDRPHRWVGAGNRIRQLPGSVQGARAVAGGSTVVDARPAQVQAPRLRGRSSNWTPAIAILGSISSFSSVVNRKSIVRIEREPPLNGTENDVARALTNPWPPGEATVRRALTSPRGADAASFGVSVELREMASRHCGGGGVSPPGSSTRKRDREEMIPHRSRSPDSRAVFPQEG